MARDPTGAGRVISIRDYHHRPGVSVKPNDSHAPVALDDIVLDEVTVDSDSVRTLPATEQTALELRIGLLATVHIAGLLDEVFDLTLRYAGERQQFGRPISAFQMVKEMIALLAAEVLAAGAAADGAVAAASAGRDRAELALRAAALRAGRAADIASAADPPGTRDDRRDVGVPAAPLHHPALALAGRRPVPLRRRAAVGSPALGAGAGRLVADGRRFLTYSCGRPGEDMSVQQAFDLSGQVAVVTGAGQGIGAAVVRAMASAGAAVAVCDINEAAAIAAAASITSAGGRARGFALDVADSARVAGLAAEVMSWAGGLSIWVNNAGITRPAMLHKMSDEDFDAVLSIHVRGTFFGIREAARVMKASKVAGTIINVNIVGRTRRYRRADQLLCREGRRYRDDQVRGARTGIVIDPGQRGVPRGRHADDGDDPQRRTLRLAVPGQDPAGALGAAR